MYKVVVQIRTQSEHRVDAGKGGIKTDQDEVSHVLSQNTASQKETVMITIVETLFAENAMVCRPSSVVLALAAVPEL